MADGTEAPRRRGRPPKAEGDRRVTPLRNFRIDDELYDAARAVAVERGENLTAVVVAAFERYVRDHKRGKMTARLRAESANQ